jgi:DNA-binding response OmpR family regulator
VRAFGQVEPLDRRRHSVERFDCGQSILDRWLRELSKQCHPEELIARIEASLRRARRATASPATSPEVHAGKLRILPG